MKIRLLFVGGLLAISAAVQAQSLKSGYVLTPSSTALGTYIEQWNGGAGNITVDGQTWVDEEFFTSRVKPRTRIERYGSGDVNNFTSETDKRIMWWVPIGDPSFWGIPNGLFDSEVFSCWSYIDHYGNFSMPWGWADGAFADVAHKNGVAVSGVAATPNDVISDTWNTAFNNVKTVHDANTQAVGKFLFYHGVDGLAYNSEFSNGADAVTFLKSLHSDLVSYMSARNPIFENLWYDGTKDDGSLRFDSFLDGKTELFKNASMFSNYNWNSSSDLKLVQTRANNSRPGDPRASFYFYAGCNMQGGEPRAWENAYTKTIGPAYVSLGYWGAHTRNMFWEGRGAGGTSTTDRQKYYLNQCETFFSNGVRNPAVHLAPIDNQSHRPSEKWHGMSTYRNAASTINHDLSANEVFYSFFNLGNGNFFNWKGQRLNDNEWYSIGIQDFMPTWRFWFAPEFMQSTVAAGSQGLQADFTWEDAYVGGSCLKISGSAEKEYLHLFKTNLFPKANNKIVVRYRLLNGEADINLVTSTVDAPTTILHRFSGILTVDGSSEAADEGYNLDSPDRWRTKVFNISSAQAKAYNANASKNILGGMAVLALEINNAKNLEILLGEVSIYPGSKTGTDESTISNAVTPNAPTITHSSVLANTQYGIDGKLVWTMDNGAGRASGTPVYNADKGVSMFKLYSQEEGSEETFIGVTTSWAGLLYKCPVTLGSSRKIRFGVSAVSADTRSESAISWSQYLTRPAYTMDDNIQIDKPILKTNEAFSFGFVDPQHAPAEWTLVNELGETIINRTGHTITVEDGLPKEGGYTLYINKDQTSQRMFGYFVQVSADKVGALPEIYGVMRDGQNLVGSEGSVSISLLDHPVLSYTGRSADGDASRGVQLASNYFGPKIGDLGIGAQQSISVAGWFRFKEIPSKTWNFMNISDRTTAWPRNEWGWCWNAGGPNGAYSSRFRGSASDGGTPGEIHYEFPDVRFQAGIWTHIAWICEYTTNPQTGFRHQLYINGVRQRGNVTQYVSGNGGDGQAYRTANGVTYDHVDSETFVWGQNYAISSDDYVYFGGPKHEGAAVDGVVDDFQVWNKAMSQSDVDASMAGFPDGYPSGMLCIWDFEDDIDEDGTFKSKGAKTGVKCSSFQAIGDQKGSVIVHTRSGYSVGCPFLSGTAMPVRTKAVWTDNFRQTSFATTRAAGDEGASGQATVNFTNSGDHNVKLSLENLYGKDDFEFPVFSVIDNASVADIAMDGADFGAYTEGNVLFLEFAADGVYDVQVYNVGGMLVASKELSALAGQNAQVALATPGVYLVKAVKDGQVLRTVKVLSK